MCCRRYTSGCARGKVLQLLGNDEDAPQFTKVTQDEERQRSSSVCCSTSVGCCCCVIFALVIGSVGGVFLAPRELSWEVHGLRLTDITPPRPGSNASDLHLKFAATVTVHNPNLIGARTDVGALAVFYKEVQLGSGVIEEIDIGGQSSQASDVVVSVEEVPWNIGQAMMEEMARTKGFLTAQFSASAVAKVPLLKATPDYAFSFEATMMAQCTLTADIRKLPEFAERRCTSSYTSAYATADF
mmetsp:Transcript_34330/g.77586  ORF Transcript_34330/g.77586 Transcript_34330/m.77586 type:complete len:242 (+) Transcript_34330:52-777(+)